MPVDERLSGRVVTVDHRSLHPAPLRLGQSVQELKDAQVRRADHVFSGLMLARGPEVGVLHLGARTRPGAEPGKRPN